MDIKRYFYGFNKFLTNKDYRFIILAGQGFYDNMDDEEYLKRKYKACMGKELNLSSPKTFNEKLQWLKLHDRKPEYTIMVDKYAVRKYIADTIGEEYLIPLLGVWDNPDDIDFDSLPNQFVLKCNHNSGLGMCICKDKSKLNIEKVKAELRKGLKQDYYLTSREWPYKDVPRKIICEKYMTDTRTNDLYDYKFFCFGGQVKCFKVDYDRFIEHHANYYDTSGGILPFGEAALPPVYDKSIKMTHNLKKMCELAEKLTAGMTFLRADFYDVEGKIYFGELTFYPASGMGSFTDDYWNSRLGEWIKLPDDIIGGGETFIINLKEFIVILRAPQEELSDYKVLCFNGEPKIIEVHRGRFNSQHTQDCYDESWNKTDIEQYDLPKTDEIMPKPAFLKEMMHLSRLLSKKLIHVRVDWYFTNNRLYFGELTFFDGSGYNLFCGDADELLGSWIKLPK